MTSALADSPTLLIATSNTGKLREFTRLLQSLPLRLRSLREFPHIAEVAETGTTFAENAALKAHGYYAQTGLWTLADDSGLEVDALGGAPGIFSARYAGADATDAMRRARLLKELARTGDSVRRARFVCALALAESAATTPVIFSGVCAGHIAFVERGRHGFGYDAVFVPDGYEQTFGELTDEVKQNISHRARALAAAKDYLLRRQSTLA